MVTLDMFLDGDEFCVAIAIGLLSLILTFYPSSTEKNGLIKKFALWWRKAPQSNFMKQLYRTLDA